MFMTLNNAHSVVALIITVAMQLFYYIWIDSLKEIISFWAFFLFLQINQPTFITPLLWQHEYMITRDLWMVLQVREGFQIVV